MESVGRATVWCVRWWLIFREIMRMCGSEKKECEWGEILTLTGIHSVGGQTSSAWAIGARAPPTGSCEHCRKDAGMSGNISVRACCYMYVWSWIQEVLDSVAVLLWQKWGGGTAAVIIDASWINGTHSQSNSFCVESVSFVCFTRLASLK